MRHKLDVNPFSPIYDKQQAQYSSDHKTHDKVLEQDMTSVT
jgi:hypothetical protein